LIWHFSIEKVGGLSTYLFTRNNDLLFRIFHASDCGVFVVQVNLVVVHGGRCRIITIFFPSVCVLSTSQNSYVFLTGMSHLIIRDQPFAHGVPLCIK
jgi:hypothetical protein